MARHPMLWRGTEARLLTAQMRGVRWERRLGGKVDKVMQGYRYLGVWAEMEMTSRRGGSAGEYEE